MRAAVWEVMKTEVEFRIKWSSVVIDHCETHLLLDGEALSIMVIHIQFTNILEVVSK